MNSMVNGYPWITAPEIQIISIGGFPEAASGDPQANRTHGASYLIQLGFLRRPSAAPCCAMPPHRRRLRLAGWCGKRSRRCCRARRSFSISCRRSSIAAWLGGLWPSLSSRHCLSVATSFLLVDAPGLSAATVHQLHRLRTDRHRRVVGRRAVAARAPARQRDGARHAGAAGASAIDSRYRARGDDRHRRARHHTVRSAARPSACSATTPPRRSARTSRS